MKSKHQNIGQWRATRYVEENQYLLKIIAVLPTNQPGVSLYLTPLEHFSSPDYGLVYRMENIQQINVESDQQSYFSSRETYPGKCPYRKVIIIGFLPGEKRSLLIALIDIKDSPEELL